MVLYPEDPLHCAVMERLESSGYSYCAILHNMDIYDSNDTDDESKIGMLKKDHWHVVISLKNPRFRMPLADELGVTPNYLEVCRNRDSALLYLVHDGFPNKYQYDTSCCFGSLAPLINKLLSDESESSRVLRVLDVLDSLPCPASYRMFLVKCCELDLYGDFRRMGSGVIRLLEEHNELEYKRRYEQELRHTGALRARAYADSITPFEALPRLDRQGQLTFDEL